MAKTSLPPGFRFHPTDVELVKYYLKRKVMGRKLRFEAIAEVDIYKYAPWDLPDKSGLRSGDLKWYFFCPREKKYTNGARMNRATEYGFWKTTGKDRPVRYNNEVVGTIKTLVFHKGKAPRGDRTDWVMHEYRIEEKDLAERGVAQDAYVLCIVFQKDGPGPRNGAQYGAPFREEDWEDDEEVDCMEIASYAILSAPLPNQISTIAASLHDPDSRSIGAPQSCLSDMLPSVVLPPIPVSNDVYKEVACEAGDDDILSMLDIFTEDSILDANENGQNEKHDNIDDGNIGAPPCWDVFDIYCDLEDLNSLGRLSGGEYDFFTGDDADYNVNGTILGENVPFLELHDLDAPLDFPAKACESKITRTNEWRTDQNCSYPEELCNQVNKSQSPSMPPEVYRFEDELATVLKGNNICGNANQAPLNHGPPHYSSNSQYEAVMIQKT